MFLCFGSLLARKETIYDDVKQKMSEILLKKVTIKEVEEKMNLEEKEYFTKCLVIALNSNENPFVRQNIT